MNVRWLATAAAVGAIGIMGSACSQGATQARAEAQAQATMTAGTSASAMGCVKVQTANACKTLKGAGGAVYDVSNAGIDLSRGKGVSLTGRDNGQTSECGTVLSDVKVDYLGISCAAPVAEAPSTTPAAG